ncbi:MAG: V-type ATP synthase subunit A [Deltaproteobacteria bacterium]|nr:V-type ATP synthase subunit A [Deltaproteobacteria bacterium]MBN2845064.1 V-type ATP synthase subunit A [Deltaproteobacteria bacterium]
MDVNGMLTGKVISVNGPIVKAVDLRGIKMFDIAEVGPDSLIGEVIRLVEDVTIIQVYEDNTGLMPGDEVISHCRPLSVLLGPGLIANIYDGIQRPLVGISEVCGSYIEKGIKLPPLDLEKKWEFKPSLKAGVKVKEGTILGEIQESPLVLHKVIIPPGVSGTLTTLVGTGEYTIEDEIYTIANGAGVYTGKLAEYWPVRISRPSRIKKKPFVPLMTGQRIIDTFFPIARGGTAAIPGGFGTGKTMTQHALAKWCNADIIVYIGCGERGNEMTDVLTDFPKLIDERNGRPLIERTVMIANTSNMPVPAREVSIYTGVTLAEYYRDMGYSVAVMADSTSRWAEALRELSSRLGDMPAEEGFPSYLATRLAEFYERAGLVETLSGEDGDITIIGAVSPPGGDFSEPVTQHTTRFVRCFWALDKVLADARHYPSISWIDSYTEYLHDIEDWWKDLDSEWLSVRNEVMNILLEDHRLQQMVKLVGTDALPRVQQFILIVAETTKNAFLQQNSFDPIDKYCSPEKQFKLLKTILDFYHKGIELIHTGLSVKDITALGVVSEMVRLKSEVPNDKTERIDEYGKRLASELDSLKENMTGI